MREMLEAALRAEGEAQMMERQAERSLLVSLSTVGASGPALLQNLPKPDKTPKLHHMKIHNILQSFAVQAKSPSSN